jgi:ribonuclease T2
MWFDGVWMRVVTKVKPSFPRQRESIAGTLIANQVSGENRHPVMGSRCRGNDGVLIFPKVRRITRPSVLGISAVLLTLTATAANAQAWQCRAPANLSRPKIVVAAPGDVRRKPVDGYILALSWSREFCKSKRSKSRQGGGMQCDGSIGDFGFILHGLWPEAKGPDYPQYCRKAAVLPRSVLSQNICMTPDVQLLQHEWAKHGTCMARTPEAYFKAARLMYGAIDFPDMDRLSRQHKDSKYKKGIPLTVRGLADAFAANNDGLRTDAIRVQTNQRGWLKDLRICLGKDFRPRRCPPFAKGARDAAEVKIWRGS